MKTCNLAEVAFGKRWLYEMLRWMIEYQIISEYDLAQYDERAFGEKFLSDMKQWIEENT